MKTLVIILDGLGDRPVMEMNGQSPLQAAETPVLDWLAERGICGQFYSLGMGLRPSSDISHMTIFGIDYHTYYTGRGAIELYGLGKSMETPDIAVRGNFAQISSDGVILDRRAKRQSPPQEVLDMLASITLEGVNFHLYPNLQHSFSLHLTGSMLSPLVSDSDPHQEGIHALAVYPQKHEQAAARTADALNHYISYVEELLKEEYLKGAIACNSILLRSASSKPSWYDFCKKYGFSSCGCIANSALENGIGILLGMEQMNARRYQNYREYYKLIPDMVTDALNKHDFIFLHVQEPDLFGEDGNPQGKQCVIEEIDKTLRFLKYLDPEEHLVIVTADHSTPCCLRAHSGDSVPIMIYGGNCRQDNITHFDEISCANGGLGTVYGKDFMPMIQNLLGKAELIGG